MMKGLSHTAALTLAIASFSFAVYANPIAKTNKTEQYPYIVEAEQFPNTKTRWVRHSFRLQIPEGSRSLEQLTIEVPDGLRIGDKIRVSDQFEQKIEAMVSVNGSRIILDFLQPVPPGTKLEIDMKNVYIAGISNGWLYRFSSRLVGLNTNIPLGVARIRVYL